jgi:hypothetical protein
VFRDQTGPAVLAYHVECDAGWCTREAWVRGWIADRPIDLAILRTGQAQRAQRPHERVGKVTKDSASPAGHFPE